MAAEDISLALLESCNYFDYDWTIIVHEGPPSSTTESTHFRFFNITHPNHPPTTTPLFRSSRPYRWGRGPRTGVRWIEGHGQSCVWISVTREESFGIGGKSNWSTDQAATTRHLWLLLCLLLSLSSSWLWRNDSWLPFQLVPPLRPINWTSRPYNLMEMGEIVFVQD